MTDPNPGLAALAQADPDLLVIPRLRYYSAGFIFEASRWRAFAVRATAFGLVNTAGWIGLPDAEPESPDFPAAWLENEEAIYQSDVVVIGGTPPKPLRGALVEVGMALGLRRQILAIGEHESFGSWVHHPSVQRVPDETTALAWLDVFAESLG